MTLVFDGTNRRLSDRLDAVERALAMSGTSTGRPAWETEETPYILAHRGQLDLFAPEHTWDAYEAASAVNAVIEMDTRSTADGALIGMHDLTTTRTCGVTATIKQLRMDDIRRMNAANHAPWSSLSPAPLARVPTFEEYLTRYGGLRLLVPEIDADVPSAVRVTAIQSIQRRGLEEGILLQSFGTDVLDQFYAAAPSIRTMLLGVDQTDATVARATAHHAWALSIDHREADQAWVAAAVAAGLKPIPYTVNDVETAEKLIGWGACGFFTDDPAYFAQMLRGTGETPAGTTVAVPVASNAGTIDVQISATYGTIGSGWRGRRTGAGGAFIVSGGYATFDTTSNASSVCVIYPGIRAPEGTWTFTTTLKLVSAAADATRYVGLRFGRAGDNDAGSSIYGTSAANGYNFFYRQNGTVSLERVSSGTGTQIVSGTWAALSEGDAVPIRIVVTPTAVTVTRTDTVTSITASDAQKPRRGFISAFASGAIPGLGASTLTY